MRGDGDRGADRRRRLYIHQAEEFERISVEAQRGYAPRVQAPFLCWHFSVWPEPGAHPWSPDDPAEVRTRLRRIRDQVNVFLREACGPEGPQFKSAAETPGAVSGGADPSASIFVVENVVQWKGAFGNPAIFLRAELMQEYTSFTLYLPINDGLALASSPEGRVAAKLRGLNEIHAATDPVVDALVRDALQDTVGIEDESGARYLNRAGPGWDKVYGEAWDLALRNSDLFGPGRHPPGEVFASFRGAVLPRRHLLGVYGSERLARVAADLDAGSLSDGLMFEDQDGPYAGRHGHSEAPAWRPAAAGRTLADNTAFRTAMHWNGGRALEDGVLPRSRERRTVANLVLEGRVLFATAFGPAFFTEPQSPGKDADAAQTAGRFAIFYVEQGDVRTRSLLERRVDRLVARVLALGTLRMIALRDFENIRKANVDARALNRRIESMGRARVLGFGSVEFDTGKIDTLYQELSGLGSDCEGGLLYRISRSKLYADTFKRILVDVKSDRVDGFEPYTEFVKRQLYYSFDSIQLVADRIRDLRERFDRLVEVTQNRHWGEAQLKADVRDQFLFVISTLIASISVAQFAWFAHFGTSDRDFNLSALGADHVPEWMSNIVDRYTSPEGWSVSLAVLVCIGAIYYLRRKKTGRFRASKLKAKEPKPPMRSKGPGARDLVTPRGGSLRGRRR